MQVLHDGRWFGGWTTANRREPAAWWGYVRYVVGVGLMHWQWKHQNELRPVNPDGAIGQVWG